MATFELVKFGCGGHARCELKCGGPKSCRAVATGDLQAAIGQAREITHHDPLSVIEVRQGGKLVCTVGHAWMSRPASAAATRAA